MIRSNQQSKNRGFTLVEALVYFSILIIVSTASIGFIFSLNELFLQYRVRQELFVSGTNVMERVLAEVRTSDELVLANSDIASIVSGAIALDDGSRETIVHWENDDIVVDVAGAREGSLTSDRVTVDKFVVYHYPEDVGEVVRVRLVLSASAGSYSDSATFYGSAVVRGDYD